MPTINDVHQQFAEYFKTPDLKGFLYQLSLKMSEGHICIPVYPAGQEDIPDNYKIPENAALNLSKNRLVGDKDDYKPFIIHNDRLYLHRYFHYETVILNRIAELTRPSEKDFQQRAAALDKSAHIFPSLFNKNISGATDWQRVAAIVALLQNFTIITGGPGTGKTTTVAKILTLLFHLHPDLKVALAAPTGKAATRMAESLLNTAKHTTSTDIKLRFNSLKPFTIHRLLGWKPDSPYFKHDSEHPLPYDLVIIDESSMIDVSLFAKLLQATGDHTRIILLGDKDQLASVEAGSLFGDLCNAAKPLNAFGNEFCNILNRNAASTETPLIPETDPYLTSHPLFQHIVQLQFSHRFKGDEEIGILSKAILRNDTDRILPFFDHDPSCDVFIDCEYEEQVFERFAMGYSQIIDNETPHTESSIIAALENLSKLRILCAVKDGPQGIHQINKKTEAYLKKRFGLQPHEVYYEHRPIMVTKNNYTLGLYNGDIGILRKDAAGTMKAWFLQNNEAGETSLKSVLPGFISNMETVFAMTIHKSQGSEFNEILLMLPQQGGSSLLTRELVYTAITRARQKVVIQSEKEVFLNAIQHQAERGSGITERLSAITRNH